VLVETEDWLYRMQHITGTVLTGMLIAQFLLYWDKKKTQGGEKDKKD
jgi:hypothetical protein